MPLYSYKAVNIKGEILEGVSAVGDTSQLLRMIKEKEYFPVSIDEKKEGKGSINIKLFGRIKTKDISIFCRQFSTMLNAGVTIIKCLDILSQQTENKHFREVISEIYGTVQKGSALSEAMKGQKDVFPEILINMIEAGEVGGMLDTIIERMAMHFEKENKVKNKIKSAMVYPILLSGICVSVVTFLLVFVMPTFIGMFTSSGVALPLPTRILIAVSVIIKSYWYLLIGSVALGVYFLRRYMNSDTGRMKWDGLKLRLPIVKNTIVKVITSRFTRTLAILLHSGIPLLQAMESVAKVVANKVVAEGIMNARDDMRRGTDLATPIRRMEIFPPMVDSMIRIGEESGALDDILEKTANFYDEEVEVALQKLVSMLEPLMIVFMAGIVGFIVISMALPMFDMIQTVK